MTMAHVALWVSDLEKMRSFYEKYFGAHAGKKYENPRKRFESYFLNFDSGIRLELMKKDGVDFREEGDSQSASFSGDADRYVCPERIGYAHIAFAVENESAVDRLTAELAGQGVPILSGPRRTGDGYYESVIADPEGNVVEITA
jgi:lactoylglutathione lyase